VTFGVHGPGVVSNREDTTGYLALTVLAAVSTTAGTVTATVALPGNGSTSSFQYTYTVPPAQGLSGSILSGWVGDSVLALRSTFPAINVSG